MFKKKSKAKKGMSSKKGSSGMAQVLHESVAASIEEELVKNETFTVVKDGQVRHCALELNVADIGGLDKKSRKVEAKGSLIEAINAGHLACILTSDLMKEDRLIFLPDANTLFNMSDYSILRQDADGNDIKYQLVWVDASGAKDRITVEPVEPERCVTMSDLEDLMDKEGSVSDLLGVSAEDNEDDVATATQEMPQADMSSTMASPAPVDDLDEPESDTSAQSDDIPMFDDDIEDTDDDILPQESDEDVADSLPENDVNQDFQPLEDDSVTENVSSEETDNTETSDESEEQDIPSGWTDDVRDRTFFSDDLGLEIGVDSFETSFTVDNSAPQFSIERPSGWLGDQLNEMSRDANAELQRIHEANLFELKKFYFHLMSRQVEKIAHDLDIYDSENLFGKVYSQLNAAKMNRLKDIESEVSKRKNDLDELWTRKLQEVGQAGAQREQAAYKERYGKQHTMEIQGLPDQIRYEIESDYEEAKREIYTRRRSDASKLLDLHTTEVLAEVSKKYAHMLAEEKAKYREFEDQMASFIEDNRANDIARTNTLAEELSRNNKVKELMDVHASEINKLQANLENERSNAKYEIDKIYADNERRLAEVEARAAEDLKREQEHSLGLKQQIDDLHSRNEKIYLQAKEEYSHQLNEKDSEISALHDRQKEMVSQQKHLSKILIAFMVALVICAVAVGFIGGTYMSLNYDSDSGSPAVEQHASPTSGGAQK